MTQITSAARELLAERARKLARPLDERDTDAVGIQASVSLLLVRVGDERVGIALDHITEVHRTAALTPIPGARPPVIGVIAWRGRVLTVLDIAQHRTAAIGLTDSSRVLVLGQHRAAFGIIADDVEDVQNIDVKDVAPVEDIAPARRELVRGVTSDAVVVLNAAALIARFAPTH